ncbi:MAG: response regulator transcription factor [Bacteroidales bacterium]|nr:response regulator transcription factor [Bacteroidales bacterium]
MSNIRIIIADDHEIFRKGLKVVLARLKNIDIIGEATSGDEVMNLLDESEADIVLMDIEMPRMNGIEATRQISQKYPDVRVLALTMFNNDHYIQDMLDAGAKGFLLKNVTKDILDKALNSVATGNTYYSDELFNFFTKKITAETVDNKPGLSLTRREKEILQLICDGFANKDIAKKLSICERTVIGHKSNLLSKTGCRNTVALISYAIKNKLVEVWRS